MYLQTQLSDRVVYDYELAYLCIVWRVATGKSTLTRARRTNYHAASMRMILLLLFSFFWLRFCDGFDHDDLGIILELGPGC
jgi:hypothetical protein